MSGFTLLRARQTGVSINNLASRSESSVTALSSGAIIAITVAGSVFIFLLLIGPLLVYRAKRQDRDRAALYRATTLSFAEHGQFVDDEDINGPRRLRKKSVIREGTACPVMKDAYPTEEGGRPPKHISLPNLPSVFSGNWRISGSFLGSQVWNDGTGNDTNGNASDTGARSGTDSHDHGVSAYGSPEKHRGYVIQQNRRKTSWIDEDALHGPRVSPKKNTKRRSNWFPGSELTRTLSRHLSFRRSGAPELARSPTLPYIETGQEKELENRAGRRKLEETLANRKTRSIENAHTMSESGPDIEPRFPTRQPLQQGGSLNSQPRAKPIVAAVPSPQSHNNTVIHATQQLAGRARVPSVDAATNAQRYSRFQLQNSSTDAALQAILRRTAERLQDGSRSARRQTLALPTSLSSSQCPDQNRRDSDQECGCGKDHARPGDATPSPTKSQKSAPAAISYSELEGCSPKIQQSSSQNNAPWQTHRRTHTRQISQFSPISIRSEPGNLPVTPSTYSSQVDVSNAALPTPSRMDNTSFSYTPQVLNRQSYSPASDKSSALSTVYSEDERSPPTSVSQARSVPHGAREMERRAMAQTLQACDAFDGGREGRDGDGGSYGDRREPPTDFHTKHDPQPVHLRKLTLEEAIPIITQVNAIPASTPKDDAKQPSARISPRAMLVATPQSIKNTPEDPFTTYTTPKRLTPQRLSQFFSPLPAELPSNSITPSVNDKRPPSETPTPSPSHRRVVPPPFRLRPVTSSPTLGHYNDPQVQIQPPSREPSPAVSESGLSSVYDSYRYSRYSDSLEGSQALARLSAATMLTVPSAEASPPESAWDEDMTRTNSTAVRNNYGGIESGIGAFRSTHLSSNSVVLGSGVNKHFIVPYSQQCRQISLSNASDASAGSTYSQDEDGQDSLGPLRPLHSSATALGKHAMRVTSAVAELRRMNSQVSCVSGYSTATTNVAGDVSPTLPALRGGGCSPGKKGAGGGAKNYLSLGNSPTRGDGENQNSNEESKRYSVASGINVNEQSEKTVSAGISDAVTIRRGGRGGRSRGSTVVERFEQDLDRARKILRESGGYNLQGIQEVSAKGARPRESRTHVAKLSHEEGCTSPMGLGLYDNKGFLRSSRTSKDLTERV
ncbi:hypothetical protein F5Y03DRAFT_150058 [Xylaria venustula]|nr:hypothetical protein F5Y03DRAFT_150058 [Xylaria venustula]